MRLARVISAFDCRNRNIDRLLETAELDVLQLDYQWPTTLLTQRQSLLRQGSTADRAAAERRCWNSYAPGFIRQLQTLHKSLYLDPSLHVITNGGGGDTLSGIEIVADFLCEHDNGNLPISAIRGDNLLFQLEALLAEGIELQDIATGLTLHQLDQPLLAAHVELGAGPFRTALDEGSRLILAGCYDVAAPLIAAAMTATPLAWDHVDKLAQLASAANCSNAIVQFDERLNLQLVRQANPTISIHSIERELLDSDSWASTVKHADVHYRLPERDAGGGFRDRAGDDFLPTIVGQPPNGDWLLRICYLSEYIADAAWQFDRCNQGQAEAFISSLRTHLGNSEWNDLIEFDVWRSTPEQPPKTMVQARLQSRDCGRCQDFVDEVKNFSARTPDRQLEGPRLAFEPLVRGEVGQFCCHVPRDAIAVSVDTRPANQWR